MTETQPIALIPGDVIQDSYGNPAVVLRVDDQRPHRARLSVSILQTTGSDRGNHTSRTFRTDRPDPWLAFVEGSRAEAAREFARSEWRAGRKW